MKIFETIKKSFQLYQYLFIFGLLRLFILCIMENQLIDADEITVSIIFFIFVIIFITFIDYKYSLCTNSFSDSLITAMLVNAIGICSSEVIMFILPLFLQIIPFLDVAVDFALLSVPYVGTIITGLLWTLSASLYNVILSLACSVGALKYLKIIGLIGLLIFNFIFDKINLIKQIRKHALKTLMHDIKNPKFYKKLKKKIINKKNIKNYAKNNAQNYAQDYAQNWNNNYAPNYAQNWNNNYEQDYSQNYAQDYEQNWNNNYEQNWNNNNYHQ
jgi:hypothetical protein